MDNKSYRQIGAFIAIVIAALALIAFFGRPRLKYPEEVLARLAQALASKGITMYGASWCAHCKAEKARFGPAWQYVPYVECPEKQELCLDQGIKGYPTWIGPDGVKHEGEQGLEKLAEIAGFNLAP